MAHMTLPAEHSEADAALAERIGHELDLREIHVFWTLPATEPASGPAAGGTSETPSLIAALAALGSLFERIGERIIAPRR
jgi:hypothetical protein